MDLIFSALRFLGVLLLVIMVFNLMIVVHELGHFLAAKWRGLKIEAFQIWFGKPLWKKTINGVDYGLGSIPAGGFVRLPQMAPMGALEGGTESAEPLPSVSPMDKIIVAFAGPLFSFGLACLFALIVQFTGVPDHHLRTTQIGWVDKEFPAYQDGLRAGDRILAIDGTPISVWDGPIDSVIERIAFSTGDTILFRVERPGVDKPLDVPVHYKIKPGTLTERQGLRKVGIANGGEVRVAKVFANSPADLAGLKEDDIITTLNGQPVYSSLAIDDFMDTSPGKSVDLGVRHVIANNKKDDKVEHEKNAVSVTLAPVKPQKPADHKPSLGAQFGLYIGDVSNTLQKPPAYQQVRDALTIMYRTVKGLVSHGSSIGVQQLSGPLRIGSIYFRLFEMPDGWRLVLWFSVILNVNLAVLNMFPFPVLDGGHIVMGFLEMIRRRPVMNLRVLEVIQTACALLLIGFMVYVSWFDSFDLLGKKGDVDDSNQVFAAPTK
jgi:regulator of sigma E protease